MSGKDKNIRKDSKIKENQNKIELNNIHNIKKINDKSKNKNNKEVNQIKKTTEINTKTDIIEVGTKKEPTIREKTRIFFNDLKIRFKNLFSPEKKIKYLPEYYDLPYKYNKDTVKILAQTPKKLFVYWDFDDKIKKEITEKYGEYFWDKTYPVLIVRNITKNYSFEVKIDDFANSWYLDIPDDTSVYKVEIGRKLKENFEYSPRIEFEIRKNKYIDKHLKLDKENLTRAILEQRFIDENKDFNFYGPTIKFTKDEYIHFGSSNPIVSPNGHILFDTMNNILKFKNITTGEEYDVELRRKSAISTLYNEYDENIYKEEKSRSSYLTTSGLAFERNI